MALVVICAGFAQTSQGHAVLRDMGLYEVPTSYTELAFTNPDSLPSKQVSAEGQIGVSFSVHNVSGSARSYKWSIAVVHGGRSQVKVAGNLGVAAQGRATISRPVPAVCGTGPNFQVVVRLASPAESIDLWVSCPASKSAKAKEGAR